MVKTKRLVDSTDYTAPKNEVRDSFNKVNIKRFSKNNLRILLVFLGFFVIFIVGIVLTSIGLSTREAPTDLGLISSSSTIACIGIIALLISSLAVILIIPISFRYFKRKLEQRKSSTIIKNN